MATSWDNYTKGQPVLMCEGGPYEGYGFFVDEFRERQANARRLGYTGEETKAAALRYRPTKRTKHTPLKAFEGAPEALVQVWVYADRPDML